jgi:hypothetical protein
MSIAPFVFGALSAVYGVVNVVFAFVPPPPWLYLTLGPDRRTRALLAFLPDAPREKAGRVLYGVACLALAAMILGIPLLL